MTSNPISEIPSITTQKNLIHALKTKPRTQAKVRISQQLYETLQEENSILSEFINNTDMLRIYNIQNNYYVEYVIYDSGYETPEDWEFFSD